PPAAGSPRRRGRRCLLWRGPPRHGRGAGHGFSGRLGEEPSDRVLHKAERALRFVQNAVVKCSSPNLTLAVLSSAGIAYAVLSSAVVPALPTIRHSLNASETGVTWLLTG